ncbi:MAG: M67 family metallopeptidase [Magnetospirillum sp.]|nr:M67 family metallopeptidase [Magnetospirillum sp.]
MLVLSIDQMAEIAHAAQAAWPAEACGLLLGRGKRRIVVTDLMAADNLLKAEGNDRFELDPRTRFAAEKMVRGTDKRVVGHWHSHPDGSARPSTTDLAQAWEPELVWLIVGVTAGVKGGGQVVQMLAHRLNRDTGQSRPVRLEIREKSACKPPAFPT